ncbi:MAG: tRNA (N(6)-L-threonylcarbamoyladenosine(37)-C(2))-methylthiotransferase MtaB, partial [Deltaproteobacteria bacterium]|nr:tRNA (N(6)-L-threonylcarbamoyladenosine(37)-C(2))-methylthiotransferase MtaB [Deltaproteobacteria bacterium]
MKKFALHTLGCKVNQFESDCLQERFARQGWILVPFGEEAEVYLVNTCAVTAEAQRQSAQLIRSALRRHPEARVIAAGCAVTVYPDYFNKLAGLEARIGNFNKIEAVARRVFDRGKDPSESYPLVEPSGGPLPLECPTP